MLSCNVNNAVNLLYFSAITYSYVIHTIVGADDCVLVNKDSTSEKDLSQRLTGLKGETLSLEVNNGDKGHNLYEVGICTSANKSFPQVGAVHHDKLHNQTYKLGSIKATTLEGGSDWIVITYKDGDKYNVTCGNGPREVHIVITCNSSVHHGPLQLVEGNKDNGLECSYLFVVGSSIVCTPPKKKEMHGLSGGSVFCILFFTVAGCYLLLGFLYKRIVVGAKGVEQIPNYRFWKDFGSLQADGCNFICRGQCASSQDDQSYRNIDDRPRRPEEDRDDQLLSM